MRSIIVATLYTLINLKINCNCSLINSIDFVYSQFDKHHTSVFYNNPHGVSDVIIRRGELFYFHVLLNRSYKQLKTKVQLKFVANKDKLIVHLPSRDQLKWKITEKVNGTKISLSILVPIEAAVGVWDLNIILSDSNGLVVEQYESPHRIIILFNPWFTEDAVYMANEKHVNEYVLNEKGMIYYYDWKKWTSGPWLYNQFKPEVLSAVVFLLNRATLNVKERANVTRVARELTYLANYDGRNRGVLRGRWNKHFNVTINGKLATKPTEWTGSASILLQYYWSDGFPVSFGQCWVFAGLLTTIYRTLGIPARTVTTAACAHDYHNDLTRDVYLDENGRRSRTKQSDGLWNFHAWTQAWFRRDDLNYRFNGWQDLDATPQERNERRYQVGPSSLTAVQNSELRNRFESNFLYSEVNSDDAVWIGTKIKSIKTDRVGLAVVTKSIGSNKAKYITLDYKPKEGTYEERVSYRKAAKSLGIFPVSLNASLVPRSDKRDFFIKIKKPTTTKLGEPFSFGVVLRNPSTKTKNIRISVAVSSVYYSDSDAYAIYSDVKTIRLLERDSQTINYLVKPEEYVSKLIDFNTIRIEVAAKSENGVEWTETKFAFEELHLSLKYPKSVSIEKHFKLKVHFKNPLNVKLTGCRFNIEGKRLDKKALEIKDVAPGAVKKVTFTLIATQALQENIVITFHSNELGESQNMAKIKIVGKRKRLFAKLVPLDSIEKGKDEQTFKSNQKEYEQYQKEQQIQFAAQHIQQSITEVTSNNYGRFLIFF